MISCVLCCQVLYMSTVSVDMLICGEDAGQNFIEKISILIGIGEYLPSFKLSRYTVFLRNYCRLR